MSSSVGSRTVGEVVVEARALLQDQREPFRYPTAELVSYVTAAVAEAHRIRPDIYLGRAMSPPIYTETALSARVAVPDMYFPQVVNYVVGRAELRDDKFATDGRAMTLITAFGVSLTGGRG